MIRYSINLKHNRGKSMVLKPGDSTKIIRTGFFVSVAIFIIGVSIFMLGSENNVFSSNFDIYARVKNAQNLKGGAAVQLKGIKVGTVSKITFTDVDSIRLTLTIDSAYHQWVREDSYVAFKTQGVLGDRFLEILGGTSSASPIKTKADIRVDEDSFFDKLATRGEDILAVSERILIKLDELMGSVERNRIDNILASIERSSAKTSELLSAINSKDFGDSVRNMSEASFMLKKTSVSINDITSQIKQGPGTLNSLIYDRSIHDDIKTLLGRSNRNKVLKYFIRETIKKADKP